VTPVRWFVGRDRELDALATSFRVAASGCGQSVAIVGEAGLGKTRLLEEFIDRTGLPAGRVLWGRCPDGEGAPAYWPWQQALRAHVERLDPRDLRMLLGPIAADIVRLVPALSHGLTDQATSSAGEAPESRFRLFDAVTTFFQRLTTQEAYALVLDDVHWADDSTMLLLGFLLAELRRSRLLVVCTYRPTEMYRTPRHVAQLSRIDDRLRLEGLAPADVREFVAAAAPHLSPSLVEEVHRVSGGNPYFLGELVRWLRREGVSDATAVALQLPEEVREVIRRGVAPLGDTTRDLLAVAATIGQEFDVRSLQATSAVSAESILERLAPALGAGLVRESRGGTARFEFVHALVRETLYHDLTPDRRAELHRETARGLEAAAAHREGSAPVAELAHHYFHAISLGEASNAAKYAIAAGERALAALAYEDAVAHFERALEALRAASNDTVLQLRALLGLGNAAGRAGDPAKARQTLMDAAAVARATGDAEALARAAVSYSEPRVAANHPDRQLLGILEDALAALAAGDSTLRVRVMAALADALFWLREDEARRDVLTLEAVAMARRIGDVGALVSALNARHRSARPALEERLAIAAESGRLAAERPEERQIDGLAWLIGDLLEVGDLAAVDRQLESFARAAAKAREPFYLWAVVTLRATRAIMEGRFAEGTRLAAEARSTLPVADPAPSSVADNGFTLQMFAINLETDRVGSSLADVQRIVEGRPGVPGWRCTLALIYCAVGRHADARLLLERLAAKNFVDLPIDPGYLGGLAQLAHVVVSLGDVDHARRLYELLSPAADHHVVMGFGGAYLGPVAHPLAKLAVLLGRSGDAAAHFECALNNSARMGARPWLAKAQWDYATFLFARDRPGDRARAGALVDEVRHATEQLGLATLARLLSPVDSERSPTQIVAAAIRRADDGWSVEFGSHAFRLQDTAGVGYLVNLLRRPGEEVAATALSAGDAADLEGGVEAVGPARASLGHAGEMLDAEARTAYRARLTELRGERDEASRFNDLGRAERAEHEIEILTQELARAVGLAGRPRRAGSALERARLNVTRAIGRAIRRIGNHNPALGEHLSATVKTGTFCCYAPDPRTPIVWQF
jgi:tetratricopeptide (TPR) repeat protein